MLMLIKWSDPVAGKKDLFLINYPGCKPPPPPNCQVPVELQYHRSVTYWIPAYSAWQGVWILSIFVSWCLFAWVFVKEIRCTARRDTQPVRHKAVYVSSSSLTVQHLFPPCLILLIPHTLHQICMPELASRFISASHSKYLTWSQKGKEEMPGLVK